MTAGRLLLKTRFIVVVLLIMFIAIVLEAQSLRIRFTRLTTTELPTLTAELAVVDESDRPIDGLSARDIRLFIDGVQQDNYSLYPVRQTREGQSIIFLVRCTFDMKGDPFYRAKQVVRQIIERLAPNDKVALVTYNHELTIQHDLTDQKVQINRLLQRTALQEQVLSEQEVLSHILSYWDESTVRGSSLVLISPEMQGGSLTLQQALKVRIADLELKLAGIDVGQTTVNRDYREAIQGLGGKYLTYRDENDIWSLFRLLETETTGLYRLIIRQAHSQDFRSHTLKVVVDMWAMTGEKDIAYIGATAEGINPRYHRPHYGYSGPLRYLIWGTIGALLVAIGLMVAERRWLAVPLKKSWFLSAVVMGGLLGIISAFLVSIMP